LGEGEAALGEVTVIFDEDERFFLAGGVGSL
jgi:hypothetical protein